jgi:hypothetical protein
MSALKDTLRSELEVYSRELPPDNQLSATEIGIFIDGWTDMIRLAAKKYVGGKMKYKTDFVTSCDHLEEANFELVDLVHYLKAEKYKRLISPIQ